MLTHDEEDYLSKVEDRVVTVKPFDPKITVVADEIKEEILKVFPKADVRFLGAASLGLSGQGDIDMYILSGPGDFDSYIPNLNKLFGDFKTRKYDSISWKFEREGIPIELYVADPTSMPMRRQMGVHEVLKNNPELRKEYEDLKDKFNGKSYKDLQKAKYEFFHKILSPEVYK